MLKEIISHNDVKGDNIVSLKQFEKKIKEFHLTFNERRAYTKDNNIHNENDKKRYSLFTNSFDTREQVKDNNLDDGDLTSKDDLNISDIYETDSSCSINNKSNFSDNLMCNLYILFFWYSFFNLFFKILSFFFFFLFILLFYFIM